MVQINAETKAREKSAEKTFLYNGDRSAEYRQQFVQLSCTCTCMCGYHSWLHYAMTHTELTTNDRKFANIIHMNLSLLNTKHSKSASNLRISDNENK